MIYFTENENENGKIDHINKTYIHVDREKNVQIQCLSVRQCQS